MTDRRVVDLRGLFVCMVGCLFAVSACTARPERTPTEDFHWVERVIDGDTIALSNGEVVRYLAMDAPELDPESGEPECYAAEAAIHNRDLVEGRWIRLEADRTNRDAFGRLLRYVFVDGLFVNAELVREGFAYSYYRPPDTSRYEQLLRLELAAEAAERGLWGACDTEADP